MLARDRLAYVVLVALVTACDYETPQLAVDAPDDRVVGEVLGVHAVVVRPSVEQGSETVRR